MREGDRLFDVIVVGGGAAGCVLAARLSEDSDCQVLLLEAGPDYGPRQADWPARLLDANSVCVDMHDWGLTSPRMQGDPVELYRGRLLGGTSAINGSVWLHGAPADYDAWAALGNPGWGYADLLPYFTRAERDALHGSSGPVPITRLEPGARNPLEKALVEVTRTAGIPWVDDLNDANMQHPVVGASPRNVLGDVRMNGALTYLAPARARANLEVVADVEIDRVIVTDGVATGVVTVDGREFAGREIVLTAGAYGSPAILMRSGIGPPRHLRDLGIDVIRDLPGVGENLLDHPMAANGFCLHRVRSVVIPEKQAFIRMTVKGRSGQVRDGIDYFLFSMVNKDDDAGGWVFVLPTSLMYARSQGYVRLTGRDPQEPLMINHRYFSDPADVEAICDGVELATRLVAMSPLAELLTPSPAAMKWGSREELRSLIPSHANTTYHPSSTCRMGPADDPGAVVDASGRVHGVRGLRVADASIFPTSPAANIHATVIAVAEKVAESVRAEM